MSAQDTPQNPYPPSYPSQPPGYAPPPVQPSRHSGHGWIWWVVAIVLILFSCTAVSSLFAWMGSLPGTRATGTLGGGGSDVIAVIPFQGAIAGVGTSPGVITPDDFLKQLERAEKDDSVKAIVLRVDSPGGTVAASEEISTYVRKAKKPIVVSVSDVDASGAYMVSSQADEIVANPGSAIGSIGVILEVPDASGLLGKVGLQFKVITAGKYKDAGTPYRALTATETEMLQGQVDQVYEQFIDIVASGRHLPRSQVETLATGWAWNGQEALGLHLVDRIGTYKDALDAAARLGHARSDYSVDVYNQAPGLNEIISSLFGLESQLRGITASGLTGPASGGAAPLAK